jgi:hypothetical protein
MAGDEGMSGETEPAGGGAAEAFDEDESFDPIGTATLIGIYMAIVVLMWIFTYFIEFLGRGLTIVG